MQSPNFGRVRLIPGKEGSRFPFCTSLFIDDEIRTIIDPGAGPAAFAEHLGGARVDYVLNTHYHFDHINGNHLFPGAKILINKEELEALQSPRKAAEHLGVQEVYGQAGVEEWIRAISSPDTPQAPYSPAFRHEWRLATGRAAGSYPYDEDLYFGATRVRMVFTPGHTAGNCCAFFPDEGMVYVGDIDLTAFGPWYCGTDGDIDLFIQSAKALLNLDAGFFVTAHQEGVFSRPDFQERMDRFLGVIEQRETKLADLLEADMTLAQVLERGIVYQPRYQVDPWIRMWELLSVEKHARRLAQKGHAAAAIFLQEFSLPRKKGIARTPRNSLL
ncbi:MAG: MBL fold metallo-hydrolase [Syntrophothermus sp.]